MAMVKRRGFGALVVLLLGLVFVEAVAAEHDAERHVGRLGSSVTALAVRPLQHDGDLAVAADRGGDRAAELQPVLLRQLRRIAEPDEDDAVEIDAGRA